MSNRAYLACAAAALFQLGSASAQEPLVAVDVSGAAPEIATTLDVELDEIPSTLRLPAGEAAQVCAMGPASVGSSCVAADMMYATRYVAYAIGDREPLSDEFNGDTGVRATDAARQPAPWSSTNVAAQ